ncbi:MAG: winged helix-turn-helix domain-containing protein, partial [Gemmatimonadaceae bacterium]|nr:winged helix-turn-helix domain-containing protein [Acetobacteraceae bacterium]
QIHRFLRPALEASGYEVERADTAADGLALLHNRPPALVLLDLGLPDMDGQDALVALRAASLVPVLILSARDDEAGKVEALDNGADDYVEKPFGLHELLARIRAALRHAHPGTGASEVFRAEGLAVDMARRTVTAGGVPVVLTPREYALLALLVRHSGKVLTHRHLLQAIWGPAHVADVQYLRVYVGHLRQKLGPQASRLVTTEPGVGYRLLDRVPQEDVA